MQRYHDTVQVSYSRDNQASMIRLAYFPPQTPRYNWQIDRSKLNITGPEVMQKLADTRPLGIGSMGAGASGMRGRNPDAPAGENHSAHHGHPSDPNSFGFAVWQLKDGEDRVIAERLAEIFNAAPKT